MRKGERLLRYLINEWLDTDSDYGMQDSIIFDLRTMYDDEFDEAIKND